MTDVYLTFDYELYFGSASGTVQRCMLNPTEKLVDLAEKFGVRYSFFVDVGMLLALKREGISTPELVKDYNSVVAQIRRLVDSGHSIQLHVHPHWEDSRFRNGRWEFDLSRYRLDCFADNEIDRIIRTYKEELDLIANTKTYVFRGGGLCVQPFSRIGPSLRCNGISADSSVYKGGYVSTATHRLDFRKLPGAAKWRFDLEPTDPVEGGFFEEYEIAAIRYTRWFYLQMAVARSLGLSKYRVFGDGAGVVGRDWGTIISILRRGSVGVATLDGFRSRELLGAIGRSVSGEQAQSFVVLSHTKALCANSLIALEHLLTTRSLNFRVF